MAERGVEVREHRFEDDGHIPNNPKLPLLFYPNVLESFEMEPARCKDLLAGNGRAGAWVNGVETIPDYQTF